MNQTIIIVGGGASALMLASLLPKNRAILIESNPKIGAKVAVSGGGKCNITNAVMGTEYFLGDQLFIAPILKRFNAKSLLVWLQRQGLSPQLRKGSQYFCRDSSRELIDIFKRESKKQQILLNETVLSVKKEHGVFYVTTTKQILSSSHLVVASGGLSFPKIGASAIGYDIARFFGHTVVKTAPALVGLTVQKEQFFFKSLSGASTEVEIAVEGNLCRGDLLFTHKGVSGPAVLDASLYWQRGVMYINFLPDFVWDEVLNNKKRISTFLPIPKRITKAFLLQLGLEDKPCNRLTKKEYQKLYTLEAYAFSPAGTFGYSKAEVTRGGVSTQEIESSSMMSLKEQGLYFIGEVLDVTGRLGGYNFQWAFSSAYTCFKKIRGK